jgi:hypothetical protein
LEKESRWILFGDTSPSFGAMGMGFAIVIPSEYCTICGSCYCGTTTRYYCGCCCCGTKVGTPIYCCDEGM